MAIGEVPQLLAQAMRAEGVRIELLGLDDRHTTAEFTAHWAHSNESKPKPMPNAYPDVVRKLTGRR